MRFKVHYPETLDTYIEDTIDVYPDGVSRGYYFEDNEDFCNLGELLNKLDEENIRLKKELEDALLDVKIYKQANESFGGIYDEYEILKGKCEELEKQVEYQTIQLKEKNNLCKGVMVENKKLKQQVKDLRLSVLDSIHEADKVQCNCNPCVVAEYVRDIVG